VGDSALAPCISGLLCRESSRGLQPSSRNNATLIQEPPFLQMIWERRGSMEKAQERETEENGKQKSLLDSAAMIFPGATGGPGRLRRALFPALALGYPWSPQLFASSCNLFTCADP
jgi:hypothetical protein